MKGFVFRTLVFAHRYIGIAIGWLMLMWCLSGFVMMYVAYPALRDKERLAALDNLDFGNCCNIQETLFNADERIAGVSIFMLDGAPVLQIEAETGAKAFIRMGDGAPIEAISSATALASARKYRADSVSNPSLLGLIDRDQWTVYPRYESDRPLYHVALNDSLQTEVYVSSTSGQVVQKTDQVQRFWNWLGAVPHWLYFTPIRQNPAIWNNLVIYGSLVGCFLTLFGLYLGIWQLRRKSDGKMASPYRGWKYWHHTVSLAFGVLVLTWVFSGLMSMQPWGFLESSASANDAYRLRGDLPTWNSVRDALLRLSSAKLDGDAVAIDSVTLQGQPFYAVRMADGNSARLDPQWRDAPLSTAELRRLAASLDKAARVDVLDQEDDFYYSRTSVTAQLPVARIILPDTTRYYLDATTGDVLSRVDRDGRWFRWLHLGLHRIDFTATLRHRPIRDIWMWVLLLGVTAVSVTGVWLGVRRLTRS